MDAEGSAEMVIQQEDDNVGEEELPDRLSQLPENLVVNILSRLTLRQASRTCVLSHRWENLWLLTTHCSGPNLIFENPFYVELQRLGIARHDSDDVRRKRLRYIQLLNNVFKFYQLPFLDELVINLYLTSKFSNCIDKWIEFAFAKGVQRLKLNFWFSSSTVSGYLYKGPYVFPSLKNEKFSSCQIHRLRDLCLEGVYINQKWVDDLVSACPFLESLSLKLLKPKNLMVSSDKLKHLKMLGCDSVRKRVEVSAICLVTLGYEGSMRALHLKCVPCLSEFYVWDKDKYCLFFMEDKLHFSRVSQLTKLTLCFNLQAISACWPSYPLEFPHLVRLEELEVKIVGFRGADDALFWPLVLVKASPFLRRLAVQLSFELSDSKGESRRIKQATKFKHQFLEVVEISGFKGSNIELEFAQHLIEIGSQALQKVVIDTQPIWMSPDEAETLKLARGLGKGLDSSVNFMVL